jgi:hypothetical protein
MASTSARTEARRRARTRLAAKAEERRQREQAELGHVTDFEAALTRRNQAETEMAAAVAGLLDLGNSVADTAALTEQSEAEIRRLHKLATGSARAAADSDADGNGNRASESPARSRHAGNGQNTLALDTDAASAVMAGGDGASPGNSATAGVAGASTGPDVVQ